MDAAHATVERKIFVRLIAPIALITFVNSIDRVNVSYSGSAMSAELGLSPAQFGQGVSMFFIAYLLFQYPHVWLLRRWGIRRWIFVSMMLWGVAGVWLSGVTSPVEFYGARFLLGAAEAGFAPGMTWLISRWTPPAMRARALAGALVAVPLSMVLGGPLCGFLLGTGNPLSLTPWRFMFLATAVPNVVLAFAAAAYLVDTPHAASWLSPDERTWLTREVDAGTVRGAGPAATISALAPDPWLWRCSLTWLLIMTGSYALVYWLPQLVRQMELGGGELAIATISSIPLAGLALGLLVNGRRSDRTGERLRHVGIPSALAGAAMLVAALLPAGWLVLALLTVAGLGIGAAQGVFWTVPGAVRVGGAEVPAGAIALISMFGTAGGIVGPWLTGALVGRSGSFSLAIAILASLLIVALIVIVPDRGGRSRVAASA